MKLNLKPRLLQLLATGIPLTALVALACTSNIQGYPPAADFWDIQKFDDGAGIVANAWADDGGGNVFAMYLSQTPEDFYWFTESPSGNADGNVSNVTFFAISEDLDRVGSEVGDEVQLGMFNPSDSVIATARATRVAIPFQWRKLQPCYSTNLYDSTLGYNTGE